MNDSFANDGKISRRIGAAGVTLHPCDAAERGLADGDTVRMWNETGSLELAPFPSGTSFRREWPTHPKGRWPKREPQAFNVNVLNDGRKTDIGESTAVHGVEVTVEALATA